MEKKDILNINKYTLTLLVFITFFVKSSYAQRFTRATDWKRYKKEIIIQVGSSGFLGDLGGLNKVGTDFSPVDLELASSRPALSLAFRYKFAKTFNIHTSLNYLSVSGDDNLTTEPIRNNRNLNFKSNIFELSTRFEFAIWHNKVGHRYGIKRTIVRRYKSSTYELIAFVGAGAFYYNPKGRNPISNQYVELRPLHTEGQGLSGGPSQYSNYSFCIPMGLAFHANLSRYWSVGAEFSYRKTFTDYIDDVSTSYYDKAALQAAYGINSVMMADPSKGDIPGATAPNADGTGAQRGDNQKDSYMSIQVSVGRFITPKRNKTRLRSKF